MHNTSSPSTVIGIDVGGSTTKIVGFHRDGNTARLIEPQFVRATDPLTSIYGAFGKFTVENNIALAQIDRVMTTGVGSSYITRPIYGLPCSPVSEFQSIGLGGLYLSELDEAIIVSMGTGSAIVHAKKTADGASVEYLGGTGVGGGTLLGLTKRLIGVDTIESFEQICKDGNLDNVDLRIKDMYKDKTSLINANLTASNFGKLSDLATPADIALGIANMVGETIAMVSVFAARRFGLKKIVLTGNLSTLEPVRQVFSDFLAGTFDVEFIFPRYSQFATVIGAALQG